MMCWAVLRLCRWENIQAVEKHGLLANANFNHGPYGEFGYMPVFATRAEAEAASGDGRYQIICLATGAEKEVGNG